MQLNKELIRELNESANSDFAFYLNEVVENLMTQVVNDISQKSPFVNPEKAVFMPVNENYTGSICQLSEYSYIFAVENPQIEFNSKRKKNWWKLVWREFRASWRIGRKKKYKKVKEKDTEKLETLEKYKVGDLRHDIVMGLAQYLSESSVIYEYPNHLTIVGSEDFGSNIRINIYICLFESENYIFKLFKETKNKFFAFSFGNRFVNLQQKVDEVGNSFIDVIKLTNTMFAKNYDRIPNQIVVESLVYNCPNILFDPNDINKTFVNFANYIRLQNPKGIHSICGEDKNIFEDPLVSTTNAQIDYGKIISMLDEFTF